MIHLIDSLFSGWAPHDIMWYSFCIMALFEVLVYAVIWGIRNKRKTEQRARHGHSYDIPMWEEEDEHSACGYAQGETGE